MKDVEKTETVNGKGCRAVLRGKRYGTSGRRNRQPLCGKNPRAGRPGKPITTRNANKTPRLERWRNPAITEDTGNGSPMGNVSVPAREMRFQAELLGSVEYKQFVFF